MDAEWLKIFDVKARYIFCVTLTGFIILFLPDDWALKFGLDDFRTNHRGWIGLVTIISFSVWLMKAAFVIIENRRREHQEAEVVAKVLENLRSLAPDEQFILAYCHKRQQKTVHLPLSNHIMTGLVAKGIFQREEGTGNITAWPFTMTDFVWEHFLEHGEMYFPKHELESHELEARFQVFEMSLDRGRI